MRDGMVRESILIEMVKKNKVELGFQNIAGKCPANEKSMSKESRSLTINQRGPTLKHDFNAIIRHARNNNRPRERPRETESSSL